MPSTPAHTHTSTCESERPKPSTRSTKDKTLTTDWHQPLHTPTPPKTSITTGRLPRPGRGAGRGADAGGQDQGGVCLFVGVGRQSQGPAAFFCLDRPIIIRLPTYVPDPPSPRTHTNYPTYPPTHQRRPSTPRRRCSRRRSRPITTSWRSRSASRRRRTPRGACGVLCGE